MLWLLGLLIIAITLFVAPRPGEVAALSRGCNDAYPWTDRADAVSGTAYDQPHPSIPNHISSGNKQYQHQRY